MRLFCALALFLETPLRPLSVRCNHLCLFGDTIRVGVCSSTQGGMLSVMKILVGGVQGGNIGGA